MAMPVPKAERDVKEEKPLAGQGRAVFPIQPKLWHDFHARIRSWIELNTKDTTLSDVSAETIKTIADMAIAAISLVTTDGGFAVSIASAESFRRDVKRKLVTIAENLRVMAIKDMSKCNEMIRSLSKGEVSSGASEGEAIKPEMAKHIEPVREAVKECVESIRKALLSVHAYLVAVDILFGSIQASLPVSLMSNAIKGRVGYLTD